MVRVILFEFNELTEELIERFIAEGKLPNFQAFRASSTMYTTDAGEDPPFLEPWIAWPAIHSGVPYAQHHAYHLGDGMKNVYPGVAEILSKAGVRVGIFGSMNTNYSDLNGYFLPDPWDITRKAEPAELQTYFDYIGRSVREHTNGAAIGGTRAFVEFLLKHGLRPKTALLLARQLVAERLTKGIRWKRAVMLDLVQYDVFRNLNKKFDVQFAAFFSNSVAHFQHYFWRNMEPSEFSAPPSKSDSPTLASAIELGYRVADTILGNAMRDYPDAKLVFCTALSQQRWRETRKCCYRPVDFKKLLAFAGVKHAPNVIPVMAEEFELACASVDEASEVRADLARLTFRGAPVIKMQQHGSSLFTGCAYHEPLEASELREPVRCGEAARPFSDLFYQISTMRSGRHHRDGVLWIRDGSGLKVQGCVSITGIAPLLLKFFNLAPPEYMTERLKEARLPDFAMKA